MDYRDEVDFQNRSEADVPLPPEEFRRRLDSRAAAWGLMEMPVELMVIEG